MIHETPPIDTAMREQLHELDHVRAALGAEVGRTVPWDGTIRRQAKYESVTGSASIEGYRVDGGTAEALVSGAAQPAAGDQNQWAVACYARAMEHVSVMSDDPAFRWLDRVILDLHFDACVFQRDKSPGRWRTGPVYVMGRTGAVAYEAPSADQFADRMAEVVDWLEHGDLDAHVAVRAAMAHLHVVSIHPFRNGNGRVARLVQSLVLARDGLLSPELGSIEPWLAANTTAYFEQLDRTHATVYDPTKSARDWVKFCIRAHVEQGRVRLAQVTAIAARWRVLEALVRDRGWPDRLVIALEQSLHGGATRASYSHEAEVHENTAQTDLRRLVDARLLERTGRGPSTSYVATEYVRQAITTGPAD